MRFLTLIALVVCISYAACSQGYPKPPVRKYAVGVKESSEMVKSSEENSRGQSGEVENPRKGYGYNPRPRYHRRKLDKVVKVKSLVDVDVYKNKHLLKRKYNPYPRPENY